MPTIPLVRQRRARKSSNYSAPSIKHSMCVIGPDAQHGLPSTYAASKIIGQAVAQAGHALVTTVTDGIPSHAAESAQKAGGWTVGFSSAVSHQDHLSESRQPDDVYDLVIYSGLDHAGRNALMLRSVDAVIFISGRIGTVNDLTSILPDGAVIGVLTGPATTTKEMAFIASIYHGQGGIIYDSDPTVLVAKVADAIDRRSQSGKTSV